jgi:hypothetical protein
VAILLSMVVLVGFIIGSFQTSHVTSLNFFGYKYVGLTWNVEYVTLNIIHIYVGICSFLLCIGIRQGFLLSAIGYVVLVAMGFFVFIQSEFGDFKLLTLFSIIMLIGFWKIKDEWYAVGTKLKGD